MNRSLSKFDRIRKNGLCILVPIFVMYSFTYFYSLGQYITKDWHIYYLQTPIDHKIPWVEPFIIPYLLCVVLWPTLIPWILLIFGGKKKFYEYFSIIAISSVFSFFFFILLPTKVDYYYVPKNNIFERLMNFTYSADDGTAASPSFHNIWGMAMIVVCFDRKMRTDVKLWLSTFGLSICLATVFIKQHFEVDQLMALVIILIATAIVKLTRIGDFLQKFFTRYNSMLALETPNSIAAEMPLWARPWEPIKANIVISYSCLFAYLSILVILCSIYNYPWDTFPLKPRPDNPDMFTTLTSINWGGIL